MYKIGFVPVSIAAAQPGAQLPMPATVHPVVPPALEMLRLAIQGHINNSLTQPAVGRTRDRQAEYAALLQTAFNAVAPVPGPDLIGPFLPCVVLPNGQWGHTIDGVSLKLEPAPNPVAPPAGGAPDYYLTITPRSPALSLLAGGVPAYALDAASTCTWSLQNPTGVTTEGVTLFLAHTRSQLLHVTVDTKSSRSRSSSSHDPDHAMVHVEFAAPVPSRGAIELTWIYMGDPPHIRAETWWAQVDSGAANSSSRPAAPPHVIAREDVGTLIQYSRTADVEFILRASTIATIFDNTTKFRKFFFELDQQTQPGAGATNAISLLTGYLRSRYMLRAEDAGFGELTRFHPGELDTWRTDALYAADMVEKIVRRHFTDQNRELDFEQIAEAFELFAGGQLTDVDTHGAPNGVNFFAFCEFAILCVELGHKVPFWSALIPIFARTSEIFARCYHGPCAPRTSCAYRVFHNPTGRRGFTDVARAELRAAWQGVAHPIGAFARMVHAALDDELFPGPVVPFGLVDNFNGIAPDCPPGRVVRRSNDKRFMPQA